VAIHSNAQTIFNFTHVEVIILSAGDGGASGMGVDRIGEVGDRTS
jgi:hypothetical protein